MHRFNSEAILSESMKEINKDHGLRDDALESEQSLPLYEPED